MVGVLVAATILIVGCAEQPPAISVAAEATTSRQTVTAPIDLTADGETTSTAPLVEWVPIESPAVMRGHTTIDRDLRVERLPEFSEAAIRGQIVGLGPADYLVPESILAEFGGSRAVLSRETSAPISTPVVVRIHEILAARRDVVVDVAVGDELTVGVSGGLVEFTVTPQDAERTGLRPDISHEDEQAVIDSGREPPQGPGPVPAEPFHTGYSSPEFVSLSEGQEVIVFVRWGDWYDPVANDGTYYDDVTLLLSLDHTGVGLFVRDLEGLDVATGPFVHAATEAAFPEDDLLDAARGVSVLNGRASSPQWLGSAL